MATHANSIPAPAVQHGLLPRPAPEPLLASGAPLPSLPDAFARRRAIAGLDAPQVGPAYTPDRPPPFDDWPAVYALRCFGDCCEPEIANGSSVIIDRQVPCAGGDFVAVWSLSRSGRIEALVKRLVVGLAPWTRLPYQPDPRSNIEPVLIIEALNPPRRFDIDVSTVYAVHRCIGVAAARPDVSIGTDVCRANIRWFDRPSRPGRARKPRIAAGGAHV